MKSVTVSVYQYFTFFFLNFFLKPPWFYMVELQGLILIVFSIFVSLVACFNFSIRSIISILNLSINKDLKCLLFH